ncbi:hypothetical protein BDV06DRAFT_182606 [Aspergillus oleicola]
MSCPVVFPISNCTVPHPPSRTRLNPDSRTRIPHDRRCGVVPGLVYSCKIAHALMR